MKSINALKAESALRRMRISQLDTAHEYYMGRKPHKDYCDDVQDGEFIAQSEIALIIETLEEEIEALKKERKKTHEEITIIGGNRLAES